MPTPFISITPTGGSALSIQVGALGSGVWMARENDAFFPVVDYDVEFAESSDSEGGLRTKRRPKNSEGTMKVCSSGTDASTFSTYSNALQSTIEAVARDGGTITFTPPGGTQVTFDVLDISISEAAYDGVLIQGYFQAWAVKFTCKPYAKLATQNATLQDWDPFARDTLTAGEWTINTGSSIAVSGGLLTVNSTANKRLSRTYLSASDCSVTMKVNVGATATGLQVSTRGRILDDSNYLRAMLSATQITLRKQDGGASTTLATAAATINPNTAYWVQLILAGDVMTANVYTSDPFPATGTAPSPAATVSYTLTGADATKFGNGIWGNVGLQTVPVGTDETYDDWRVRGTTFRSSAPIEAFQISGVPGHVDALGDLTLTELSSQTRRHIEGGLEPGSTYDPTTDPVVLLDSDQLVTSGTAGTGTTRTGAFDPNASGNSCISALLTPNPVAVCATGPQKHVGPRRVKARIAFSQALATTSDPELYLRLVWHDGDGTYRQNPWVALPASAADTGAQGKWYEVDLGTIAPTAAVAGTQQWEGRIEAKAVSSANTTLYVDYMVFMGAPSFKSRVPGFTSLAGASLTAADEFNQAANNIDLPLAARLGGSWGEASKGTATGANGLKTNGTGTLFRTTAGDTHTYDGAQAFIGSNVGACAVQVDVSFQAAIDSSSNAQLGVLVRHNTVDRHLRAVLQPILQSPGGLELASLAVIKRVGGTDTVLFQSTGSISYRLVGVVYTPLLFVDVAGNWTLYIMIGGSAPAKVASGWDADLAAGSGTIDTGKVGIYDSQTWGTTNIRAYDNFLSYTPESNAVIYSGQTARLRDSDSFRMSAAGTVPGQMPNPEGPRMRIPPAGPRGLTSRLTLKARRNDADSEPDTNLTDVLQFGPLALTPRVVLLG